MSSTTTTTSTSTRASCVSCGGSNKRSKLLMCLHTLCTECLQQHTTYLSEVKCARCARLTPAPPAGTTQLQSLPDSYADAISGAAAITASGPQGTSFADVASGRQPEQINCDDCVEDTAAETHCIDCSANFCRTHASAHPLSRHSYKHRIVESTAAVPSSAAAHKNTECPLHPPKAIVLMCTQCNELLCEQCQTAGQHEHTDSVVAIADAAATGRRQIADKLNTGTDGQAGASADVAIEAVDAAIADLDAQKQATAAVLARFFAEVHAQVERRQAQLLAELDRLHTAKREPLRTQRTRLDDVRLSAATVSLLLNARQSDVNFVRMSAWLAGAVDEHSAATGRATAAPCTMSSLRFNGGERGDELRALLADVGSVTDASLLAAESSVVGADSARARVGKQARFAVRAVGEDGKALPVEQAKRALLSVVVTTPGDTAERCELSGGGGGDTFSALYTPSEVGKHTVRATAGGANAHLSGSPLEFTAEHGDAFDAGHTHPELQLSNNNTTVENTTGGWKSALGADTYLSGCHEFAVRVDAIGPHSYNAIGVSRTLDAQPELTDDDVIAWPGYIIGQGVADGSGLGQPWRDGDVLRFTLDCDDGTLSAVHERTGATGVMETGNHRYDELRLFVAMGDKKDKVTILGE